MDKKTYHRNAKKLLREVAKELNLPPDQYDLRTNYGGPAVLGETTLHTEKLYVQIGGMNEDSVLYRSCKGRKDYCGGGNRWTTLSFLRDDRDAAIVAFKQAMGA